MRRIVKTTEVTFVAKINPDEALNAILADLGDAAKDIPPNAKCVINGSPEGAFLIINYAYQEVLNVSGNAGRPDEPAGTPSPA